MLATCHSAGGRQLWNNDFDVVIIDEATQALEAVGLNIAQYILTKIPLGMLDTNLQG